MLIQEARCRMAEMWWVEEPKKNLLRLMIAEFPEWQDKPCELSVVITLLRNHSSSSSLTLFKQGGGQSTGHGPQQHLQEGKAPGGETGWAVPDSARDHQRGGQRSQAGRPGVPVPVQVPQVELHQPPQILWENTSTRWVTMLGKLHLPLLSKMHTVLKE